ncbi:hypothetical protein Daus18300_009262 [Diaporthe australafricana]|uniref:DUF7791 domain-containing protein n=1 Tax=Diaporthe australafricana TaxID=127596 RepID=A0ABR3WET5_9PEZI
MMMELKKYDDYRISLLAYSFLEEYETGSNYLTHANDVFPMSSLTGDRGKERATSTTRRLAGWCKGLVEPYTMQYWVEEPLHDNPCVVAWKDWAMELDFAHRSVFEFLELARVQLDSQLVLRDFDHVDAILNLIVSDLLFENTTSLYNTHRSGSSTAVILGILEHYNMNHEPYTYLERVRDVELESWPDNEIGPTSEDGTAASLQISLKEFVENSEFDNKDIILQMLDEQSKLIIGVQTNTSNAKALMSMKEGCIGDESALQGLEGGKDMADSASSHFHPQPAGNIGAQHASRWIVALLGNEYFRLSIAALTGAIIATLFMYIRE